MARYFEHPSSGVKRFDKMNSEWRSLVLGVRDEQQFKRSSPEIENTVASWHQEERDVCLLLSRRIGERVSIRLSRNHQADPAHRLRDACDSLIASLELRCAFSVPNAASDVEVTANLQRRTISCSMKLNAPGDKKRASARVNWLVRQLRDCQWRSKKGPPRRCKKGPLGGCGFVPVVHGRAPRATRRALNRLTRRRAREGPVGPRGQAWAGWSVQLAVGV